MKKKSDILLRRLCISALMAALSTVIGIICKSFTFGFVRITLENFPLIFTGFCFGPVFGAAAGMCADLVSCLVTGQDIQPIITLGVASVGLVSGLVSLAAAKLMPSAGDKAVLGISVALAHLLGQVCIKCIGKTVYYGIPYFTVFWPCLGVSCLLACAEYSMIFLILRNHEIKRRLDGLRITHKNK